jgi:uncharacterized protein YbjT (DUF2867 family)
MILITGATGNVGSEVVKAVRERGGPVRAFVRDPDKAREKLGDGVELAIGDFADPGSLRAALNGVDEVFLSCADDPRRVEWETNAIEVAVASGARRIVKLSAATAERGSPVAFWDWHARVEQHLRESEIASVILRPSWYMSNLLAFAERVAAEGRLYAPAGEARIAMIDPRDVGAAAAAVLTTPGHDGRTYILTGPEAITFAQAAAELSAVIDSEVEFVNVPDEGAREAMAEGGLPDFVAEQVVKSFVMLRQGVAEQVTGTVESLTGTPARGLGAFARDYARLFAPAVVGAGR